MKFKRGYIKVKALLDFDSKVNTMSLVYASKQVIYVCSTDVEVWKINRSIFLTYGMVLANFQLKDKQEKMCFF